uniref:Uncharacterized protein n=1 Tax=Arundo donax TaxID=35708 RepID=A0A0A8Y4H4_ARUDO
MLRCVVPLSRMAAADTAQHKVAQPRWRRCGGLASGSTW